MTPLSASRVVSEASRFALTKAELLSFAGLEDQANREPSLTEGNAERLAYPRTATWPVARS